MTGCCSCFSGSGCCSCRIPRRSFFEVSIGSERVAWAAALGDMEEDATSAIFAFGHFGDFGDFGDSAAENSCCILGDFLTTASSSTCIFFGESAAAAAAAAEVTFLGEPNIPNDEALPTCETAELNGDLPPTISRPSPTGTAPELAPTKSPLEVEAAPGAVGPLPLGPKPNRLSVDPNRGVFAAEEAPKLPLPNTV